MEDTGNICREENIEITFTFESRLNERSKIATLSKSTAHQQTSETEACKSLNLVELFFIYCLFIWCSVHVGHL